MENLKYIVMKTKLTKQCVIVLALFLGVFSSCENSLKKGMDMDRLSTTLFAELEKTFSGNKNDLEENLNSIAINCFPDFNRYCYTKEKDSEVYALLNISEKVGLVHTTMTGKVSAYYGNQNHPLAVSLIGDFPIPKFYYQAETVQTIGRKVLKEISVNGSTYYIICYPNESVNSFTSCSGSEVLSESVKFETKLILFTEAKVAEEIANKYIHIGGSSHLGVFY